jgi:hypothetical protein
MDDEEQPWPIAGSSGVAFDSGGWVCSAHACLLACAAADSVARW